MSNTRLTSLLEAHMDGRLTPGDVAELERLLMASETARRQFWEETALHGLTLEAAQLKWSQQPAVAPQMRRGIVEIVAGLLQLRWRLAWAGGLAAVALAAIGAWLWLPRGVEPAAGLAQIVEVRERVVVTRAERELEAGKSFELRADDVVRIGARASATVVYADATRLEFAAGSQATFDTSPSGGKQLNLVTGALTARVSKQPVGKPLIVCTPHATVTVVGTVFKLAVVTERTRLEVSEGLVNIAHAGDDHAVAVAAGECAEVTPGMKLRVQPLPKAGVALETASRDPARWPFVADSPWNHPMGSEAAYADIVSPVLDLGAGATINRRGEGRPVFAAGPDDPVRRIFKRDRAEPFAALRIPPEAAPDNSPWAFLNLIDEEHRFAYEMNGARRREDGDIEASQCFRVDLRDAGVPPEQMGSNVSGIPSLAGLIRKGELAGGIRHALACIVLQAVLNRNGPNGHAFVWPAGVAPTDPKWTRMLSATGNLHLGTLLAIPPSVDIAAIGVGDSGPAFEIARALQDYGVYISGAFEGKLFPKAEKKPHIGFWIEPTATEELPENIDAQLALIVRHLKVVGNNGPASIGGGGVPRRPLAPNFTEGAR